ncbi:MAG: hypothetical protein SH857_06760 [Chitinophagales bacterium]|nr:hypothetical protein [Chitinophagales bacterium]
MQLTKYRSAVENAEEYIAEMSNWDDKRLVKHLDLFQQQTQMAYKQQNHEAYELLQEYERQVICARLQKNP